MSKRKRHTQQRYGVLRAARNLTLATLIEAVRAGKKQAGLELVNKALLQPHWRTIDELL